MSVKSLAGKDVIWHHYPSLSEEDFNDLQVNFRFHQLDIEDIRGGEGTLSKIDFYKHYAFCVFHIPTEDERGRVYGAPLFVFLSKDSLVTATRKPIPSVDQFFERVEQAPKFRAQALGKGPAFLMYRVLHRAFYDVLPLTSRLSQHTAELEDQIGEANNRRTTLSLGRLRRNVLYLRHIVDPERKMLSTLVSDRRALIEPDLHVYFDDLQDTLETIWLTAGNLKLIIDGLFDVNESILSHKTNDVITILTLVSATLMAPALVVGFYGMNVTWLPFAHHAWFVGLLLVLAFVLVAGIVMFANRGRHA